ncbi:MAG TPA: RHS repeat-associated core domain-containing protein, partial [Gemmataceae bacterium]|nr:RHS repeat-associated core domain-containing protein [Gemmataceae bacterium]
MSFLPKWFRRRFLGRKRKDAPARVRQPGLELLEDRLVPSVSLQLLLPPSAPYRVNNSLEIQYTNTGTTAAPAPLLVVSADNANLWLPTDPTVSGPSLLVLATGPTGPAGTLAPGAQGSILVDFTPTSSVPNATINFSLGQMVPGQTINWASLQTSLRPSNIPADAWNALFSNFTTNVGSTTNSCQAALDADATYLAQIGEPTNDVARLFAYEITKADAAFPGGALAGSVDDSLPAPGPPLSFERQFLPSVSGRYTLSTLGRGWVSNWDVSASTDGQGNVTIDQSGNFRSFTSQLGGAYLAAPGDHGVLTALGGGGYQLADPDGTFWVFNPDGTLGSFRDSNDNGIVATYSGGLLSRLTDSNGSYLTFSYTNGLLTTVADSAGGSGTYTYDPSGQHLLSFTGEFGTTTYSYVTGQGAPSENALASVAFPNNSHIYYSYDPQGRLIDEHQDSDQEDVTYSYGFAGGYTVTNALGAVTTLLTDDSGRVCEAIDALGNVTRTTYDAAGNVTQVAGPQGAAYGYGYDANGNLTSETDPLGRTTTFTYNANNDLTGTSDAKGNTTTYSYDGQNDLLGIFYANNTQETYSYNSLGEATQFLDANGKAIGYTYDSQGEVATEHFADGTSYAFTYDDRGNLTSAAGAAGTTTFQYQDSAKPDLVTEIDYPNGQSLKFTYNAAGERTQSVDQTGYTLNYTYDAQGRLEELTDGGGHSVVRYTYDGAGEVTRKDMGNGTRTTYGYDAGGDVVSITNLAPNHVTVDSYDTYTYDAAGNVLTDTNQDGQWCYTYDAGGQLTNAVFTPNSSDPDKLPNQDLKYNYDAAGDRVSATDNGVTTTYTTNNVNEYTSSITGGVTTTYQYDKDGNLTSQAAGGSTTNYTYNELDQLTGVSGPGLTATYTYDLLGNRNSETIDGTTTQFLIDLFGLPSVASEYSGGGDLVAHYDYGLGLVSRVDSGGSAAYYQYDLTGDTTGLTGDAGASVSRYAYLPFGQTTTVAGSLANPFTFVGEAGVSSDGSGLFHMGARSYDPVIGQFTQNDPLGIDGGDANTRRYVINSPTDLIDPTGRDAVPAPGTSWTNLTLSMTNTLMNNIAQGRNSGSLAGRIDSPFYYGSANRLAFTFQDGPFPGQVLTGNEVAYAFQGTSAAASGEPLPALYAANYGWTGANLAGESVPEAAPRSNWPAQAELDAATAGYQTFAAAQTLWQQAVTQVVQIVNPGTPQAGPVIEGIPATVAVGNFTWGGSPVPPASDFTATTAWADGVTTIDTVELVNQSGGSTYEVFATRVFGEAGTSTGTTTILGDGHTWTQQVTETVDDAPLVVNPVNFFVPVGQHYVGPVATFQDFNPQGTLADYTAYTVQGGTNVPATIQPAVGNTYTVTANLDFSNFFPGVWNAIVGVWDLNAGGPNPPGGAVLADNVTVGNGVTTPYSTSVSASIVEVNGAAPYSGVLAVIDTTDPGITGASQVTVAGGANYPVVVTGVTMTLLPGGVKEFTVQGIVNAVNPGAGPVTVPLNIHVQGEPTLAAQMGVVQTNSAFVVNPLPVAAVAGQPLRDVPVATIAGPANGAYSATIDWGDGDTSPGQVTPLGGGLFAVSASKPNPYAAQGTDLVTITVSGPGASPPPPAQTTAVVSPPPLPSVPEDTSNPAGTLIAALLQGHFGDPDANAQPGIAVTQLSGNGTWQYFNGRSWVNMGSVSQSQALLLPAADQVRFVPALHWAGQASMVYFAWDGSQGTAGGKANITTTGGASAFSFNSAYATMTVTPVNHAPVWVGGPVACTPVLPGTTNPAGDSVISVFGASFTDIDPNTTPGIAVTSLTGTNRGSWQYSTDGTTWIPFGSVSASAAQLLSGNDLIRFVPNAGFAGTVTLLAYAWDGSSGSDGGTANLAFSGATGGGTAFSTTLLTATLAVNTAPTLASTTGPPLTPTNEDVTSAPVTAGALLAGAGGADVDAGALKGIAVVGASGPGTWQYSLNGTTWQALPAVSESSGLLLAWNAWVRFAPALHQTGPANLTYRAWDQTAGTSGRLFGISVTGGATALSATEATATLTVNHVNHAPVWVGGPVAFTPVLPGTTNPAGDSVTGVFGASFTDIDPNTTPGIAVTSLTGTNRGTWQYSTNGTTWAPFGAVS